MKRYLDALIVAFLWYYATEAPTREYVDDPPPIVFALADLIDREAMEELWSRFAEIGLVWKGVNDFDTETFHPKYFSGSYYVVYRRAIGRPLRSFYDGTYGYRIMHPDTGGK